MSLDTTDPYVCRSNEVTHDPFAIFGVIGESLALSVPEVDLHLVATE